MRWGLLSAGSADWVGHLSTVFPQFAPYMPGICIVYTYIGNVVDNGKRQLDSRELDMSKLISAFSIMIWMYYKLLALGMIDLLINRYDRVF